MVRECKTLECLTLESYQLARSRLIDLCGCMSKIYGVDLRRYIPSIVSCPCSAVNGLKKFCGELLEGADCPQRDALRGVSARHRFGISASLFLFRKVLPSPEPDLASYVDVMSTPSPEPDKVFLDFCEKRLEKMFPRGWDRQYKKWCDESVLPSSSCTQMGRGDGGCREFVASGECWYNYDTFKEITTYGGGPLKLSPSSVVSVDTGGKKRIVSVPSADMNFLRPLHKTFYDRISRFSWLLRGDANPKRFKDFTVNEGEVFVSGDYESATDNLNSHVQKFILRKVLETASHVPQNIKDLALASLEMDLFLRGVGVVKQRRGQLMGNLLSFPLLCVVNFLAFKFVVRRYVPVRINGDDIVFRASPKEQKEWFDRVGSSGLTLSPGKTLVHKRFFSLNSCFFEGRKKYVKRIPVIRSKPMFGCVDEGVLSLRDRFRAFSEGFDRLRKDVLNESFLRLNRRFILASGRSVRNGLCIPVSDDILRNAGLLNRESLYLEPTGSWTQEVALADVVKSVSPYKVDGWILEKVDRSDDVINLQKKHSELVRELTWTQPISGSKINLEEKKRAIKESGKDISCAGITGQRVVRFSRLANCSRREASRYLNRYRTFPPVVRKAQGERWWVPDVGRSRRIVFLSSGFSRTV